MARLFRGFSTVDKVRAPYTLTDVDLVKRDLQNEFYTRKGERVMRPNFGSIVWDLLMDPTDTFTEQDISDDVERIVNKDPRVELINISIFSSDHAIRVEVELKYVILNSKDILYLEFTRQEQ